MSYLLAGIALVLISVALHMSYLIWSARVVRHVVPYTSAMPVLGPALLLCVSALGMIMAHLSEAFLWALLYFWGGQTENLQEAIYFSIVTATTLGYGDITMYGDWRIVASFEAMCGLLLFGASTAALFQLVMYVVPNPLGQEPEVGH